MFFLQQYIIKALKWLLELLNDFYLISSFGFKIIQSFAGGQIAPPWFAGAFAAAMQLAMQPTNARLNGIEARLNGIEARLDVMVLANVRAFNGSAKMP